MDEQINRVFYNPDGYIEVVLVGEQSNATFIKIYEGIEPIRQELNSKNMPLLCLFDLGQLTGFSIESGKAAIGLLESTEYDKVAMFATPHQEFTQGVIMASGKGDTTKIFKTRKEAVKWLLSNKDNS